MNRLKSVTWACLATVAMASGAAYAQSGNTEYASPTGNTAYSAAYSAAYNAANSEPANRPSQSALKFENENPFPTEYAGNGDSLEKANQLAHRLRHSRGNEYARPRTQ